MKRSENFGSITIFNDKCALVYEPDKRGAIRLVRCIPLDGHKLFECCGNYDKKLDAIPRYILAETKREAIRIYKYVYGFGRLPWSIREITSSKESEKILTNINTMPL